MDSGFQKLDSGFQSLVFRIPQAKISWIPESGLPYMGRSFPVSRNKQVLIRNKAAMFLLYNKSDIDQAFSVEVAGY